MIMNMGVTWSPKIQHTVLVYLLGLLHVSGAEDYCHHEVFNGRCLDDQVVVMTRAKYGRMRLGRCIKTNFGYKGCETDVLDLAHARCSGRRSCDIHVPDAIFDGTQPCHEDLKTYLEVEYDCVNVSMPEVDTCSPNTTNNVTAPSGYFASIVTTETACGNEFSPWKIWASPGQRINITLIDYGKADTYKTPTDIAKPKASSIETAEQILCKEIAMVEEDGSKTTLSSCDGSDAIDGLRYTSTGHNVTLYFRSRALEPTSQYLISYEVIGCPDIEAGKFTWVTREGDKISVGCLGSELTWHLTCSGNVWHGQPGNCSAGEIKDTRKQGDGMSLSFGTSVIIIIVVSGIVGIIVLLVGLFCMKRYRARQAMHDMPMKDVRPLQEDTYDEGTLYARNNAFQSGRSRMGKQKLTGKNKGKGSKPDEEYEYVWDMSGTAPSRAPTPDGTLQTSTCLVAAGSGRGTPKSPRAAHTSPTDPCRCPEIHVHVHHSTENRLEGGQSQVSRVHIQAKTDHCTMPRMATTMCRTPVTRKRDGSEDFTGTPGTLRAIQPPPTPQRNRKTPEMGSHGHSSTTMGRSKSKDSDRHRHLQHQQRQQPHGGGSGETKDKRYWTLPVGKSAFSKSSNNKSATTPDSTG